MAPAGGTTQSSEMTPSGGAGARRGRPHQCTQLANTDGARFMHAQEDGGADRQGAVTDLADDGGATSSTREKRGIVLQLELGNDGVEYFGGIVSGHVGLFAHVRFLS